MCRRNGRLRIRRHIVRIDRHYRYEQLLDQPSLEREVLASAAPAG
jgi:hypothetical protein